MRKSWLMLGLLAACVAALALFVWLKPPKQKAVSLAVSILKPADARGVRVLRGGKTFAVLEKREREWFLSEPLKVPAEAFQVERLLAVLDAKAKQSYPATDAAKFELDAPQAELIINDQRFAFGAINNVTREQYVLTQNQIYPLELRHAAAIPDDALKLARRSVLAPGDAPVKFEFGAFTVAYDGKKWRTTPAQAEASQDDFNRWVAQWREGSALRVELADARKAEKEFHITLKDGAKVALGITQADSELIVRRADIDLQFVFVGDVGEQMLAPPIVR